MGPCEGPVAVDPDPKLAQTQTRLFACNILRKSTRSYFAGQDSACPSSESRTPITNFSLIRGSLHHATPLLVLLLLIAQPAVCTVSRHSPAFKRFPSKLFNEHRTRSQAAAQNMDKLTSMIPQQAATSLETTARSRRASVRTFSPDRSHVAVVNPYLWSYPTIAAIVHAVRASGIRPEVRKLGALVLSVLDTRMLAVSLAQAPAGTVDVGHQNLQGPLA